PGMPQAASIEARARQLIRMHERRDKALKSRPKLLQALAWDLMEACCEKRDRNADDPVGQLMQLALGLPALHGAGRWTPDELDNRGGRNLRALVAARDIEYLYEKEYGKKIATGALVKELSEQGFEVPKSTVRTWRKRGPPTPQYEWLVDDPWETIPEILNRWRARDRAVKQKRTPAGKRPARV